MLVKYLAFALLCCSCALAWNPFKKKCPAGYIKVDGFSCYRQYREQLTWTKADKQCREDNGLLVIFDTTDELNNVSSKFYNETEKFNTWVGVQRVKDQFVPMKGKAVKSGHPTGTSTSHPFVMFHYGVGADRGFKTATLKEKQPFICEY